jgi:hypothetical protein
MMDLVHKQSIDKVEKILVSGVDPNFISESGG